MACSLLSLVGRVGQWFNTKRSQRSCRGKSVMLHSSLNPIKRVRGAQIVVFMCYCAGWLGAGRASQQYKGDTKHTSTFHLLVETLPHVWGAPGLRLSNTPSLGVCFYYVMQTTVSPFYTSYPFAFFVSLCQSMDRLLIPVPSPPPLYVFNNTLPVFSHTQTLNTDT